MSSAAWTRAVFDCNVYLQALINPHGPAGACLNAAVAGRFALFCSDMTIVELRETAAHPDIQARFLLDDGRVAEYILNVERVARFVNDVPSLFSCERDPDDAHYINLALATRSAYVVTRDRDLLDLTNPQSEFGAEFAIRFPNLAIVTPVAFLQRVPTR